MQEDKVDAFAFPGALRRAHHVRARVHHVVQLALQILRCGSDLELAQVGDELRAGDALEEAVADFVEGVGVFDGGGDVGVVAEAVEYLKKGTGWHICV